MEKCNFLFNYFNTTPDNISVTVVQTNFFPCHFSCYIELFKIMCVTIALQTYLNCSLPPCWSSLNNKVSLGCNILYTPCIDIVLKTVENITLYLWMGRVLTKFLIQPWSWHFVKITYLGSTEGNFINGKTHIMELINNLPCVKAVDLTL